MTGLVADERLKKHDTGDLHPEKPARTTVILDRLAETGLDQVLNRLTCREANPEELALAHEPQYLELVDREVAQRRTQLSTGDTTISPESGLAARLAAGGVLNAVDAVFSGQLTNAFCVVRPPGHHASAARGMGFCLYNNVAVAARYAQKKYSAERVLIVDWDVHHGNGTQDIFYEDGSVLFFSTHQSPWYPGTGARSETGEEAGAGRTINCPLPAGTGAQEMREAFGTLLLPAVDQFKPDFVLISAGFDSRAGDPLGQFRLTDSDFAELTGTLLEIAEKYCGRRLVSVLEGGYSLSGLPLAAESHIRTLISGGD